MIRNSKKNQFSPLPLVLSGLVVLVGVVSLYCYLSIKTKADVTVGTPTPTNAPVVINYDKNIKSWSTYTNSKYGYSLKYPSILMFSPDPGPESAYSKVEHFALESLPRKDVSEKGIRIDITVSSKSLSPLWFNCVPEKDCLTQEIERGSSSIEELKYSNRIILGKQRKSFLSNSINPLYFLDSENFAFVEKGQTWLIDITGNNYTIDELSPFIDQFLSTIKRTK
jgi:hypothetical protein